MTAPSPEHIFSRIYQRYDRLNRVLSLGQDQAWRRQGISCLPDGLILDLGAGTGVAMPLFTERQQVVALDPVWPMLSINPAPQRVVGKGERLPFADGTFDGIWSAFVFRNLQSVEETLVEAARVLRPGGVMVVVDAGRPLNRLAAAGFTAREPRWSPRWWDCLPARCGNTGTSIVRWTSSPIPKRCLETARSKSTSCGEWGYGEASTG